MNLITNENNRILKNTLLLYIRMILNSLVSLFSIRIVLEVLGVEEYGLFTVVAGIVGLLSFLPTSLASATQRFLSYAIGKKDKENLNKIIGINSIIYIVVAVFALLILNSIGLWCLETYVKLPIERISSLKGLFVLSNFTFFFKLLKSPLMAILIAFEEMKIYAYLAIVESILKLIGVLLLTRLSGEKILIYGFILLSISIIETLSYFLITKLKFKELNFKMMKWDKSLGCEIISFTGWTLFGQLTTVFRGSAITLLINQYFNPAIVAARSIAVTISSQSNFLAQQFNTSLYPPIIKSYASKELENMYRLVINGSKVSFFLMWLIALPLMMEIDIILKLWLKEVPEFSGEFAILALIETSIFAVSIPLATAARAPGNMKLYETVLGFLQISIFVLTFIFYNLGYKVQYVFYTAIAVNFIMFVSRLIIVQKLIHINSWYYFKETIIPIFRVVILSYSICHILRELLAHTKIIFPVVISSYILISISVILITGLSKEHRMIIKSYLLNR